MSRQGPKSPPAPSRIEAAQEWIKRQNRWIILAIVLVSLLLRGGVYWQLSRGPCLSFYQWDQTDMNYFDGWARQIVAGDWLSRDVRPPLHFWHRQLAEEYFRQHPDAAERFGQGENASERLWDSWIGGKTFYQEPLFPYLVALTYKLFGPDMRIVLLWQMLLGTAGNMLVYGLTRRFFGALPAVVAAALAVFYAPFLYLESLLLRETLIVLAALLLVLLADIARQKQKPAWWIGLGVAMGLSLLLKSHFVLFLLGMIGVAIWDGWRRWREPKAETEHFPPAVPGTPRTIGLPLLCVLLGILLGLSPLAARNLAVGAPLLGTASMGGVNFAIGNVYNPEHEQGQFEVQRIVGVLEKSRGKTAPAIIASIQTFPSGWAYVEHLGRKFAKAFNWYEEPDNANFYYFSLHSWLLRWLPGRMVTVAPLGLLGLVLAARNFRRAAPLYLLVATCLAVPVLFFVADRFRAPLAAALIPFAGLTLCRLVEWFAGKAFRKSVPALVAVALLAWWANSGEPTTLIRPIDYRMGATLYYLPEAERAMRQNDFGSSLRIMKENLALEPEGLTTDRLTSEQAQVAAVFGQLNAAVAAMLKARGLEQQAQHYEQHALSLQSAARRTMN